jgi:Xaa-Pro dipeptidase
MFPDRIAKLRRLIASGGMGAAAVLPGPNLEYLTGLSFHLMERPVVGLIPVEGRPRLILPEFESVRLDSNEAIQAFPYDESDASRMAAFRDACAGIAVHGLHLAVEPLRMRFLEENLLQAHLPGAVLVSGSGVFEALRVTKEPTEVESMRRSAKVAQRGLDAMLARVRAGVTERELAGELVLQMLRAGSDTELPFPPNVSFGPNSALPHHLPTDRVLRAGDLLLIDWGARVGGYASDLTRVFAFGEVVAELRRVHALVLEAQRAAVDAIRPGVTCAEVDRAARSVIERAGHGPHFLHRTGHGLGLEAHEPPWIRSDSPDQLQPGMTFTVEPGVYLAGLGGMRIEDNVAVTPDGSEILTDFPRELTQVG